MYAMLPPGQRITWGIAILFAAAKSAELNQTSDVRGVEPMGAPTNSAWCSPLLLTPQIGPWPAAPEQNPALQHTTVQPQLKLGLIAGRSLAKS